MAHGGSQRYTIMDRWIPYGMLIPPCGVNATATGTPVSNSSYMTYLGKCPIESPTTVTCFYAVRTGAATITWAEIGIFSGAFSWGAAPSLTRRGWTDVSAINNSAGGKSVAVTVSGIAYGDDVWFAWGSQATTCFQLCATAQSVGAGLDCALAATRISTVTSPTSWTLAAYSATLFPGAAVTRWQ